jgi:hypothetical protein
MIPSGVGLKRETRDGTTRSEGKMRFDRLALAFGLYAGELATAKMPSPTRRAHNIPASIHERSIICPHEVRRRRDAEVETM